MSKIGNEGPSLSYLRVVGFGQDEMVPVVSLASSVSVSPSSQGAFRSLFRRSGSLAMLRAHAMPSLDLSSAGCPLDAMEPAGEATSLFETASSGYSCARSQAPRRGEERRLGGPGGKHRCRGTGIDFHGGSGRSNRGRWSMGDGRWAMVDGPREHLTFASLSTVFQCGGLCTFFPGVRACLGALRKPDLVAHLGVFLFFFLRR